MIEEDLKRIEMLILDLDIKVSELYKCLLLKKKNNSKHLAEAKELANKGKKPRKQPKSAREAFESK